MENKTLNIEEKLSELQRNDITKQKIQSIRNHQKSAYDEFLNKQKEDFRDAIEHLYASYIIEEKEKQKLEAEKLLKEAKQAKQKKDLDSEASENQKESDKLKKMFEMFMKNYEAKTQEENCDASNKK